MANFFEFSKVAPPSFGDAAQLMANAQKSVVGAAEAFSTTAQLFHDANVEKDTRVKQNNTDLWNQRINAAQTPEEVELIKAEIGSEQFQKEYGNGFYIDTNAIMTAAEARPEAIRTYKVTQDKLNSMDENDNVSGYLGAVELAKSDKHLDQVLQDVKAKGLTLSNTQTIIDAIEGKRTTLKSVQESNLRMAALQRSAKQEQDNLDYNRSLNRVVMNQMEKYTGKEVDLGTLLSDPRIRTELVDKYGKPPAEVEAQLSALYSNYLSSRNAAADATMTRNLSADTVATITTANVILSAPSVDQLTMQEKDFAKGVSEVIADTVGGAPLTKEGREVLTQLQTREDNPIDTSQFALLPQEFQNDAVLTRLTAMGTQAEFDGFIAQIRKEYPAYLTSVAQYRAAVPTLAAERDKEKVELRTRLGRTQAKLSAQVDHLNQLQIKGASVDEIDKVKAAHNESLNELEQLGKEAINLTKPIEVEKVVKWTDASQDIATKAISEAVSPKTTVADKQFILDHFKGAYNVSSEDINSGVHQSGLDSVEGNTVNPTMLKQLKRLQESITGPTSKPNGSVSTGSGNAINTAATYPSRAPAIKPAKATIGEQLAERERKEAEAKAKNEAYLAKERARIKAEREAKRNP